MNNNEDKCEPHGFTGCCNIVEVKPDPTDCLDYREGECAGSVEYRMAMSPTGKNFVRCDKHFDARMKTQRRLSRDYGVQMFY